VTFSFEENVFLTLNYVGFDQAAKQKELSSKYLEKYF